MSEVTNSLNIVYTGRSPRQVEDIDLDPFLLNKFLSFNPSLSTICKKLNWYIFFTQKEIMKAAIWSQVPKQERTPFYPFLKSLKDEAHELDFLLKKIQKHYGWNKRELELNLPIILQIIKDKKEMQKWFQYYGIEKRHYTKYKLKFDDRQKSVEAFFT